MNTPLGLKLLTISLVGIILLFASAFSELVNPLAFTDLGKDISVIVYSSLGATLLSAAVIGWVVESGMRRDQRLAVEKDIAEIKENVFKSVYKRDIPLEMMQEISESLLSASFIRKDYTIENRISLINVEVGSEIVKQCRVSCTASYRVKNTSDVARSYPIILEYMAPKVSMLDPQACFQSAKVGDRDFDRETLERDHRTVRTNKPGFKRYEIDLEIPPRDEVLVFLSWIEIRDIDDHIAWFALDLSQRFSVSFSVHIDNAQDGNYGMYPLHPFAGEPIESGGGEIYGMISSIVLPYQGYIVWWRLRDDTG